jgi:hypothetical protein
MINPLRQQKSYRARNDTVALNSTSFTYGLNTPWVQFSGDVFRVRFVTQESAGAAVSVTPRIEFRSNTGSGFGAWIAVSGTTDVRWATSSQYSNGTATTALLDGTGTFAAGLGRSGENDAINVNLAASGFTEHEWSLSVSTSVTAGTEIELRLTSQGTVYDTYTATPSFVVATHDTVDIYAQVFKSDGVTSLTGRVLVAADADVTTSYSTIIKSLSGLATLANKSDWDGARIKVEWVYTTNASTNERLRITALDLDGYYEASAGETGDGAVSISGTPVLDGTGDYYSPVTGDGSVSYDGVSVASEGDYLSPVTGDGALDISGTPVLDGSGTFGSEEITGDGAVSLTGAPVLESSGDYTTPEVTGDGAVTYASYSVVSDGAYTPVAVSGDGTVSYSGYSIDADGSFNLSEITGEAAVEYGSVSVSGSGTHEVVEITGDAVVISGTPELSASGTLIDAILGNSAVVSDAAVVAGSGTAEVPQYVGDGAVILSGTLTVNSSGSYLPPETTGEGAVSYAGYTVSSSGDYIVPVTASGAIVLATAIVDAAGTTTIPEITGSGAVQSAQAHVSGSGLHSVGETIGEGEVVSGGQVVSSSATYLPPVTGTGDVFYGGVSALSSGTYTPPEIIGFGAVEVVSSPDISAGGITGIVGNAAVSYGNYEIGSTASIIEAIVGDGEISYLLSIEVSGDGEHGLLEIEGAGEVVSPPVQISASGSYVPAIVGFGSVVFATGDVESSGLNKDPIARRRTVYFNSTVAFQTWLRNNPRVKVISVGTPQVEYGYDLPIMLQSAQMAVTYIEFPKEI